MDLNASGIYEILNTANGKRYIGSARNFAGRWKKHRLDLKYGKHHSPYLQASYDLHGAAAFQYRILLLCSEANLLMYEQRALDVYRPEYNVGPVAGCRRGMKLTPEQCAQLSARSKRMWAENYEKMCAAVGGTSWKNRTTHSVETRQKISASKRGRRINYPATRGSRGPCPAHVREKIAAAQRGVPRPRPSEETRQKLRVAQTARRQREAVARGLCAN